MAFVRTLTKALGCREPIMPAKLDLGLKIAQICGRSCQGYPLVKTVKPLESH